MTNTTKTCYDCGSTDMKPIYVIPGGPPICGDCYGERTSGQRVMRYEHRPYGMDWDEYAEDVPHDPRPVLEEPPQKQRIERMAARCVGTVLDVGSSDGLTSWVFKSLGHEVEAVDASAVRAKRVTDLYGIPSHVANGEDLPFGDSSFDTVVLGEVLEHTDNPGMLFAEAARVARERVVVSVPLNGWADPTHLWRISVEVLGVVDPSEPTKGQQMVMTWQKGLCWPRDYFTFDPKWAAQFWTEPTTEVHIDG